MFIKIIRHIFRFLYVVKKTSLKGITWKQTNNIVWLKINGFKFFREDQFIDYMALIHSLSTNGLKFKISLTSKPGKYSYKTIFFRYSKKLDPFHFGNYTQTLYFFSKQLEDQKCFVYPKSNEILFWENKGHMTQQFFEHKISTPKTFLVTNESQLENLDLMYPFLIKEEHSASAEGLFKIQSKEDLKNFFKHDYFSRNKFLIVQELLNMRRDLRVILLGNKIVHHYWRINNSNEWKPTSTSHGSGIDFGSFPEQWRDFIIEQFQRLNLTTGAFDIAWRNDDLSTEPLILEVSPNYQPNPIVDLSKMNFSYGEYKDKLLYKDSYDFKYVDIVFSLINQQIIYLKEKKLIS